MGSSTVGVVASPGRRKTLKREDCIRTKHDSAFSPWKVLIGPFDWKDHSVGKEGVERYRVHNLPNCTSCSGIYELGIAVPKDCSGRETRKLEPNHIVPVYIGQADNVRTRLQQYGREGAHLENGKYSSELNALVQQRPRLFSAIFSRGYSLVYRWAPMKNKSDAVKTEAQLLDTFDYAWNKGSNGVRRPNDVFNKLEKIASQNTWIQKIATRLRVVYPKKMGIEIQAGDTNSNVEKNNFLPRILKIGRSRPTNISSRFDLDDDYASVCGVALGDGSVCRRPPIEGRKRCAKHRGMRINGITSKLIEEGKFFGDSFHAELAVKGLDPICGINLENGSVCDKRPVQGRERCADHKGRKITGSSKFIAADNRNEVCKTHESHKVDLSFLVERLTKDNIEMTCGVNLSDGTFCTNPPVKGRKRCKEHKGMRITPPKF